MMTEQCDFSHRCDACKRFAAKAERTNMFQVIYAGYFARSMPEKRQLQFIARNACAIVRDTDKLQPAAHQINTNLCSSSINAVLDQFFDNGCGSLNHFSGSNFGGDIRRELTYWHGENTPDGRTVGYPLSLLRTSVQNSL